MKYLRFSFLFLVLCLSCQQEESSKRQAAEETFAYTDNIKFNHLYFVLDAATYDNLFDSIPFLERFGYLNQSDVETGAESWSGKYIEGNQHYIEIFKPGGYKGSKLGKFGIAFMTNKLGVLDSLHSYWQNKVDSIAIDKKSILGDNEGDTLYTFRAITKWYPDTLRAYPWLMEHDKSTMTRAGFSKDDLKREIEYQEYMEKSLSTNYQVPIDSVKYDRLFEKVTAISISVTQNELSVLLDHLLDFGFKHSNGSLQKDDFLIDYKIVPSETVILNKISFELRDSLQKQQHTYNNITMKVNGSKATLLIKTPE